MSQISFLSNRNNHNSNSSENSRTYTQSNQFDRSGPSLNRQPENSEPLNDSPGSAGSRSRYSENSSILCECGLPSTIRSVRKEGANFGKEFHACSKNQSDATRCNFFSVRHYILIFSGRMVEHLLLLYSQSYLNQIHHICLPWSKNAIVV